MITKVWKVYGKDGHRQRISFEESKAYNWSTPSETRIVEVLNSDKTKTNNYTIIRISRDSGEACEREFEGQLSDGIFENSQVGEIYEVNPTEYKELFTY